MTVDVQAMLRVLSDQELVAVISRAMREFDLDLLKNATEVMAERKS